MQIRRSNRKLPPDEIKRLKALAIKIDREEKPDLVAGAKARLALRALKAEREKQGLSLSDVAARCGIDKGALSRLENSEDVNPTVATLERYAEALGRTLAITLH